MSKSNLQSAQMAQQVGLHVRELVRPMENMLNEARRFLLDEPSKQSENDTAHGFSS